MGARQASQTVIFSCYHATARSHCSRGSGGSNDIGMSRQMVDHYMRFKDQMGLAADGRKRLKLVTPEG